MKKRILTASLGAVIGCILGVAIALQQNQSENMIWICLACGLIAFAFGFFFELRIG